MIGFNFALYTWTLYFYKKKILLEVKLNKPIQSKKLLNWKLIEFLFLGEPFEINHFELIIGDNYYYEPMGIIILIEVYLDMLEGHIPWLLAHSRYNAICIRFFWGKE